MILDDSQYIVPSETPLTPSIAQHIQPQPSQSQQQQQQSSQSTQQQQTPQTKSVISGSGSATGNSGISNGNDAATYQEANYANSSTNEAFTLQNQEDKDLETRLK